MASKIVDTINRPVEQPDSVTLDRTAIAMWILCIVAIIVGIICLVMGRTIIGAIALIAAVIIGIIAWRGSADSICGALKRS